MKPLLEQRPGDLRRVAVFRALQLGDLLCAVPALRALRAALPEAEITLLSLPWAHELAKRLPRLIDSVVPFPGFPGLPEQPFEAESLPPFLHWAHERRFDLAIQLHGDGRTTNTVVDLLGARWTAGYRMPDAPARPNFFVYPDRGHESWRYQHLLEQLGAPQVSTAVEFPLLTEDVTEARQAVPGLAAPYAIIHAGARHAARRWPPERFAAIATALAERGLTVVLTGTDDERPLTQAVRERCAVPVIDAAGATRTLGAMAALVAGAALVVTNDTGTSHLAAASRTPSVVIFQATSPERWAPRDRDLHVAVAMPDTLREGRGSPPPVATVLRAVDQLLQRVPEAARGTH